MTITDKYGTYEIGFRRFYEGAFGGKNFGIEAVTVNGFCTEVYDDVAEWEPEYFVKGRHEYPNPRCFWAKPSIFTNHLISEGKIQPTGRTTDFYGVTYFEIQPDETWFNNLRHVLYN